MRRAWICLSLALVGLSCASRSYLDTDVAEPAGIREPYGRGNDSGQTFELGADADLGLVTIGRGVTWFGFSHRDRPSG